MAIEILKTAKDTKNYFTRPLYYVAFNREKKIILILLQYKEMSNFAYHVSSHQCYGIQLPIWMG